MNFAGSAVARGRKSLQEDECARLYNCATNPVPILLSSDWKTLKAVEIAALSEEHRKGLTSS